MKRVLVIATFVIGFFSANAQEFSKMDKSPMDREYYPAKAALRTFEKTAEKKLAGTPKIRVTYSRPAKKGPNSQKLDAEVKYRIRWMGKLRVRFLKRHCHYNSTCYSEF